MAIRVSNLVILYTIFVIFLFPWHSYIAIKSLFFSFFGIFYLVKSKVEIGRFFILFMLVLISILNFNIKYFRDISLLMIAIYIFQYLDLSKGKGKLLSAIIFGAILLQLNFYSFYGRPVLSIHDPNFSGLLLLLAIFFFDNFSFHLFNIVIYFYSFLLLSRNFLLGILIFLILSINKLCTKVYTIFSKLKLNFFVIMLTITGLVYIFSGFWLYHFKPQKNEYNLMRLVLISDASNYYRFKANFDFFNNNSSLQSILFGLNDKYVSLYKSKSGGVIHNSFLSVMAERGLIWTLFYFYLYGKLVDELLNKKNFKYFGSYLIFSIFLHGCFIGFPGFFFLLVLGLSNEKKNHHLR